MLGVKLCFCCLTRFKNQSLSQMPLIALACVLHGGGIQNDDKATMASHDLVV